MKFRAKPEVVDAQQWFPDKPHPSVRTSLFEIGLSCWLHEVADKILRDADGHVGVIGEQGEDQIYPDLVYPGNWIVTDREKRVSRMSEEEFRERFEAV